MLAVLLIEMEWLKENRTLKGAIQRQRYYKPVRIEDDVELDGQLEEERVFLKKCLYYQQGDSVISNVDSCAMLDKRLLENGAGKPFTGRDEYEQKNARLHVQRVQREKGDFCKIDKLDIPCVDIVKESDNRYRVKWFDYGKGMPRRRGGNEDLYRRKSKAPKRPNVLNETAFILREGEAGMLKYNYRYAYYSGQWYTCFYVYVVNDKVLTQDIFLREYDYEYDRLADLF